MSPKTGVTADENSDLHNLIKLYFKVYIYITSGSDTEKSENSSEDRYRASEQMHIFYGYSSDYSAKCKQM